MLLVAGAAGAALAAAGRGVGGGASKVELPFSVASTSPRLVGGGSVTFCFLRQSPSISLLLVKISDMTRSEKVRGFKRVLIKTNGNPFLSFKT